MSKSVRNESESSSKNLERLHRHQQVFSMLGQRLSAAPTIEGAAAVLLEAADELLGWDCAAVNLYSPEMDTVSCVLAMDLVNGRRVELPDCERHVPPTAKMRQVMRDGAQLILRESSPGFTADCVPFGDKGHPSASLMFVPVRYQQRVTGVLTIQSYTPKAYTEQDLAVLQALADHGGGALERIQVEGLLHRTEELYRRAIGGVGAVPYIYDYRTHSYSFIGEGIEALTGYTPKEINAQLWLQIVKQSAMAGDAAGLDKQEAARRVTTGELRNWRCDMRVVTREGKSRWISDASVQNLDEAGRAIGSMGILEDITERKQAELSALALSKLSQSLIGATNAEEVARLLAKAVDELYGWDACDFHLYLPEKDEIESVLYIDTVDGQRRDLGGLESRTPSAIDRRVLEKGTELILKDSSNIVPEPGAVPMGNKARPSASIMRVPVRLRTKKLTGIVAFHSYTPQAYSRKDLNTLQTFADCCGVALERIWADDALRQSESQFRLVWEASADGMRLTNREGIILRVNDAYCRMVEKSRAELEGHPLSVIESAANAEQVLAGHSDRFDSNQVAAHVEKEVTLWNGKRVWFDMSNSLLEVPGKPALLLSIFRDITRRKNAEDELERMHRQLLDVSREAGMAEVATSVLHNVGNVLNSVNISSSLIASKVKNSKVGNVTKAVGLMQDHAADLAGFLTQDPKGKQLLGYLKGLAEHLTAEQKEIIEELKSLGSNIEHINEIVSMQQNYAKVLGVVESLPVADLVEDALRLNAGALGRHHVQVIRNFAKVPPVLVDKHKVLQILINLIRNAKYALDDGGHEDKRMIVRIAETASKTVKISVIDNGVGIPPENLTRIFEHGFTTRKQGHGFGLHNGALAAKELGGSLTAHSDGPGKGAMFTLELPLQPKNK